MQRLNRFIHELSQRQWLRQEELKSWDITRSTYGLPGQYTGVEPYPQGKELNPFPSKNGTTYFFRAKLELPADWNADTAGLIFDSGGEGLLRVNGASYQGIDDNHTYATLDLKHVGRTPELEIEMFDIIPEPHDPLNRQATIKPPITSIRSLLVLPNEPVRSLMYTVTVVRDSAALLPDTDFRRVRLMEALHGAMDAFTGLNEADVREGAAVSNIEQQLRTRTLEIGGNNAEGREIMVGQSHIDIAWLWPVRETVRKTSRTFSSVDTLMREYPDYLYTQSQPILFDFLKQNDPELYERVKARIREGRWELVGGMWVEPDLNIPSGESLMRQMLYGQRFYQEEFGKISRIEWLPDTFGYCASLPQILKHGGVDYFMTTKLNWNDTNVFPYDLFHWVGIDGTPILSYLNHGVNEHTHPKDVHEHWQSYRQKDKHPEQMLLYGHGDGGGGVTREMLEYIDRAELMVGQPSSRYGTAAEFFDGIRQAEPELPVWRGDLYLELHRGTYTTHAYNKRANRKAEVLYREAELWNVLAAGADEIVGMEALEIAHTAESDGEVPAGLGEAGRGELLSLGADGTLPALRTHAGYGEALESLHRGWKLILLNQFHDIIPGSAITETYETSDAEYAEVFAEGSRSLDIGTQSLTERIHTEGEGTPYVIFNSLGWNRFASVTIEQAAGQEAYDSAGEPLEADYDEGSASLTVYVPHIPSLGYTTIWLREAGSGEGVAAGAGAGEQSASSLREAADASALSAESEFPAATKSSVSDRPDADLPDLALPAQSAIAPHAGLAAEDGFPDVWETPHYTLTFNDRGEIVSLIDKQAEREVIRPGEAANVFQFFHDRPTQWDAWDIDPRFEQQPAGAAELLERSVVTSGGVRDVLRFRWKLGESIIEQDLILYKYDRRIDFKTHVSWHEAHKLLKVAFPVDVLAEKATYEIPFGSLERPTHRNTSWEQAQFEVCGHRFADVSERGYGVSLLNDCKYGYDIQGSTIRLSLLRAPKWPDTQADLGEHDFTYSLYPHAGSWVDADTVQAAAALNQELPVVRTTAHAGHLPPSMSLIIFTGEHVILDTVKPAEDGTGIIVRMYESAGGRETVGLNWRHLFERAFLSGALEEDGEELELLENAAVWLTFKPYEIKTVKLIRRS
ncbi:alpha-mannosidase [Saccharibacillus brassicae]|uniref:Alpha-mannosidase n=1 Tax=Saccharibacillus brassicae TaxID=2583377 RepID=A0A4Y6UV25_SACBS|nr:alpha-mannosidase [Saccharibacillus brassicae]QDH20191.1 alpha-mannosidase [Saccharibacillus brassicae]